MRPIVAAVNMEVMDLKNMVQIQVVAVGIIHLVVMVEVNLDRGVVMVIMDMEVMDMEVVMEVAMVDTK